MGITTIEEILTGVCHLDGSLFLNMKIKEEKMKPIQSGKCNLNNIFQFSWFLFVCLFSNKLFVNELVIHMSMVTSLSILDVLCNVFFRNQVMNFKTCNTTHSLRSDMLLV